MREIAIEELGLSEAAATATGEPAQPPADLHNASLERFLPSLAAPCMWHMHHTARPGEETSSAALRMPSLAGEPTEWAADVHNAPLERFPRGRGASGMPDMRTAPPSGREASNGALRMRTTTSGHHKVPRPAPAVRPFPGCPLLVDPRTASDPRNPYRPADATVPRQLNRSGPLHPFGGPIPPRAQLRPPARVLWVRRFGPVGNPR
jgi:hypothetical protein